MSVLWRFAARGVGAGIGDIPREGDPTRVCPPNFEGAGDEAGVCFESRASFLPLGDAALDGVVEASRTCFGICGVHVPDCISAEVVGLTCGVVVLETSFISS